MVAIYGTHLEFDVSFSTNDFGFVDRRNYGGGGRWICSE